MNLVETYDVKCLAEREKFAACPTGGLNPFYTGDLYFELDTKEYWDTLAKKAENNEPTAFDTNAWVNYQCARLEENHADAMAD